MEIMTEGVQVLFVREGSAVGDEIECWGNQCKEEFKIE